MDIRRLEAFSKVYELRSFSKAGQELFLSQPTISAHVSTLENVLGVQLFDRLGRVIMPTSAANVLYKYAQEAFAALESARAEILLLQEKVAGELCIGGSTIPAHYLLPDSLAKYRKKYPDVTIRLTVGDTEAIAEAVSSGQLIMGVVGGKTRHDDLVFEPISEDEMILVAAPHSFPEGKRFLSVDDLDGLSFVMREKGSGTRKAFEDALKDRGVDPRTLDVSVAVESNLAALQCVSAGMGVSPTSRMAAADRLESGELIEVDVRGLTISRSFYLAYNSRRHMFPVARYFVEYLKTGNVESVESG